MKKRYLKKGAILLCLCLLTAFPVSGQNTYCEPTWSGWAINEPTEPITLVQLGQNGVNGINNPTSDVVSSDTPRYEDFSAISMNVVRGESYTLKVKGNTDGNNTNYITVYFDWNGDGTFSNSIPDNIEEQQQWTNQPEKHQHGMSLINSTGLDDVEISYTVNIPTDAVLGSTRMRIVKNYNAPSPAPCSNPFIFGQVEDYTLNITEVSSVYEVEVATQNNVPAVINTTNGTLQLEASVLPTATASQAVTWSVVSGTSTVSVSPTGLVTALINNGTAVIRATSVADETKFDEIEITVDIEETEDYCIPEVTIVVNITNVQFADINKTSSAFEEIGYEDFTDTIGNVTIGLSYDISVTVNNPDFIAQAYFDWNQNNSFDSGELYPLTLNANEDFTASIAIPSDAELGSTRMRIITRLMEDNDACADLFGGQIEDYTVNISESAPVEITEVVVTTQDNVPAEITTEDGTLQLVATVSPSDANQEVIWSVISGEDFANVDSDGLVTAIANGTVTVRATSVEDDTMFDDIEIVINITENDTYCQITDVNLEIAEAITNVTFAGINNPSPLVTSSVYENFTDIVGSVIPGASYPISITGDLGEMGSSMIRVYIDWNQNGVLNDPGESYYIGVMAEWNTGDTVSGSISVPESALTGNTRMRIVKDSQVNSSPCQSPVWGQVEDYTINVTNEEAEPCEILETFSYNFDDFVAFPQDCWAASHNSNYIMLNGESNKTVRIYVMLQGIGTDYYIVSPPVSTIDGQHYLSFDVVSINLEGSSIQVGTMSDQTDFSSFVSSETAFAPQAGSTHISSNLPTILGHQYVAIKFTPNGNSKQLELDNIEWKLSDNIAISSIEVTTENNVTAEITNQGGTLQLIAVVNPTEANQDVVWSVTSGEEFASIDENGLVTAITNGTVTIRATSVEDQTKFDEIDVVINFSLSVKDTDRLVFKIYPNPTNDIINIETSEIINRVTLFDVTGKEILNQISNQIDLTQFSTGIYFIRVKLDNGLVINEKIVKK